MPGLLARGLANANVQCTFLHALSTFYFLLLLLSFIFYLILSTLFATSPLRHALAGLVALSDPCASAPKPGASSQRDG